MKHINDHRHELDAEEIKDFPSYEVSETSVTKKFRVTRCTYDTTIFTLDNGEREANFYADDLGPWAEGMDIVNISVTAGGGVFIRLSFEAVGVGHPAKGRIHGGEVHLPWEPEVTGRCLPAYLQGPFADLEAEIFKAFPHLKPGDPIVPSWRQPEAEGPKRRRRRVAP